MIEYSNFHTHTVFSDGKNTPRECIETARAMHMSALGLSDHSYTPFDLTYCMRSQTRCEEYEKTVREEIRIAKEEDGFPVFLGVEYDFGSENVFDGFDYRIGSVHYILRHGEVFPVDSGAIRQKTCLENEFHGNKLDYAKAYFEEVVEHARRNRPDIVGHFDLLNKYGLFDGETQAYCDLAREALAATVREVPIFEINAGAMARGLRKAPYPASFLLRELCRLGGRVILSSDAHYAANLTFAFPEMLRLLHECGFEKITRFSSAGFVEDPINSYRF